MKVSARKFAAAAVLAAVLATGAALPASAALELPSLDLPSLSLPWSKGDAVESMEPGEYAAAMTVGASQQLAPVLLPEGASASVSYASSDESVATVSRKGVVTAAAPGTVRITATAGSASVGYDITVQADTSTWVAEMDITLSASRIAVGDTASLQVQILPTDATNVDQLTLSSSDESVATVNSFGKITGVGPGTATITATCGAVSASAKIAVVSSASEATATESITLNTNYVTLKPGGTVTLRATVTPSSASQKLTYKTSDSSVAAVSAAGVITATGTGSASVVVSNGTTSALVTVIVNRNAASSTGTDTTPAPDEPNTQADPTAQAIILAAEGSEVTLAQADVPTLSTEALEALRTSGKTLVLTADTYTLRVSGADLTNTANTLDTALTFAPAENGLEFTLNNGSYLPGTIEIDLAGEAAAYQKLYLHNASTGKWQYLNTYADGTVRADTAGQYLLTNETLNVIPVNWYFLGAACVVVAAIGVAYIAFKKRYWFW